MADSFDKLGDAEITDTASLFEASEFGRKAADDAAFALVQFAADIEWSLKHVPVVDGSADRKARRVARHARRAAAQMVAVRESMKKIPAEFNKTYEQELSAQRNRNRPRFDISKGA